MSKTSRNIPLHDADAATRLSALRRGVCSGLRRVNRTVDPDAAAMLEALLDALVSGDLAAIASELGLVERGGMSRDATRAKEFRDNLLRELHRCLGLDAVDSYTASLIATKVSGYARRGWMRDRHRTDPPADPVAEICWHIMRLELADRYKLLSARQVLSILTKKTFQRGV
ncbi:hypothetical protein [Marivita sp.]|uniref:hypothetical protein n=1 Tax=Marivita sp. TaxID=2003365 RepID=UPI002634DEFB|nr:hypothetical protein [Marivita sp.]